MVGDDDVEPAAAGLGDLGVAGRTAVDRDDHRGPDRLGPVEGRDREAVALLEAARDVWLDRQPVAFEGLDHDRQPGQPVRVEVAEDEHALTLLAREREPSQQDPDVGEQGRVVQPVEGIAEERVDGGSVRRATGHEEAGHARRQAVPRRGGGRVGRDLGVVREHPAETRLEHVHQSDIRRCTAALTGASIGRVRKRNGGVEGRGSWRRGRAGGPPRDASPRAAGWPRRSRSTSRTRCRSAARG